MIGRTIAAALTVIAVNVSVYGFVAWLPTFMVKQGMTMVQSLGFTTLMSFGASPARWSACRSATGSRAKSRDRAPVLRSSCSASSIRRCATRSEITIAGFALVTASTRS